MGQPVEYKSVIVRQDTLSGGIYQLALAAPELAKAAQPGQFVMFGCGSGYDPFLRRPLSIHQVRRDQGEVSFLYRVSGKGTEWLAARRCPDQVSLLGPLGRGYRRPGRGGQGLLVGAGMGIAPLLFLAESLAALDWRLTILMGARTATGILRRDAFERCGVVRTITEDGSAGGHGAIFNLLQEAVMTGTPEQIYACGPPAVLKEIQRISIDKGIPAQISLEERMACGVGACMGCVCQGAGSSRMVRVCTEGPVFDANEVILSG